MSMIQTGKGTKKLTDKEKFSILKETEVAGGKATLARYDLYPATFYYWEKEICQCWYSSLPHGVTRERLAMIRKLEKENLTLKQFLPRRNWKASSKMKC